LTLYYNVQDVRRGLNSVRKICKTQNISGVHGPIIELLNCDEKFFTAVEVTAGNRSPRNSLNKYASPRVTTYIHIVYLFSGKWGWGRFGTSMECSLFFNSNIVLGLISLLVL
jgi:hypothetical protein